MMMMMVVVVVNIKDENKQHSVSFSICFLGFSFFPVLKYAYDMLFFDLEALSV